MSDRAREAGFVVFHPEGSNPLAKMPGGSKVGGPSSGGRGRSRTSAAQAARAGDAIHSVYRPSIGYWAGKPCPHFVSALGSKLVRQRDGAGRTLEERASAGLRALRDPSGAGPDLEVTVRACCGRGGGCRGAEQPCRLGLLVSARLEQAAMVEAAGAGVSVSERVTVSLPSAAAGSASRGGGGGKRGGGRGGRGERAAGAGLEGADDPFSFTGVEIEDWEAAAGSGAAAGGGAVVSTLRAKARVREVCRSIAQAGVQHAIPAEADEVAAAIGVKFDSGVRALTDVEGAEAMQNVFIEELGALRALPLGASREIEWLRHNRCLVMMPGAETLAVKRARRDGDTDVSSSDEGGEEESLGRADKEALLLSFYSIGFDKFSKAEVFGRLTTAEVSEVCKEVAEGANITVAASKVEGTVRACYRALRVTGHATIEADASAAGVNSYTLLPRAFGKTASGQAMVSPPRG